MGLSSWLRTGKVIKDTPVVVHNIHPKEIQKRTKANGAFGRGTCGGCAK